MNSGRVVAVTGATGFLGLHLVAELARQGAHVRILTRRDPVHDLWRGLPLDVVPGDLENTRALERLVDGAGAVVHGAGLIKARNRAQFMRTNRDGTRAVAEATYRRSSNTRFVAISSLAAREPQLSDYAASKRAGEDAARAIYADALDRLVIVRPPAIYGPWDRETLTIFKAASQPIVPVFGSGRATIIHVSAAASAITCLALGQGQAGLYALADPQPEGYTLRNVLGEAASAVGNAPQFVKVPDIFLRLAARVSAWWGAAVGDAPIFTPGKVREILHEDWSVGPDEGLTAEFYQVNVGIQQGFPEVVAWYREAKWLT